MNFGQKKKKLLVISSSIPIFERGSSKHNATKSYLQASLKLDTLDALMEVSLCMTKLENGLELWRLLYKL